MYSIDLLFYRGTQGNVGCTVAYIQYTRSLTNSSCIYFGEVNLLGISFKSVLLHCMS